MVDLTVGGSVLPVRGSGGAGARKERRKQHRRMSKIEDRIRELEAEEARVTEEYEDMQTALALSLTQEERDLEASARKRLLEEQHAAYMESLAKDKAVRYF